MRHVIYLFLCTLVFLCACEKSSEISGEESVAIDSTTNLADSTAKITEMYCSEIPDTQVQEKDIKTSLNHETLVRETNNRVYKLIAIYNCLERNDSIFYVIQPRTDVDNNLNCLHGLIGEPTRFLSIEKDYTTEWKEYIGIDPEAYYRSYTYDEENQTFKNLVQAGYNAYEFKVQYADKEHLVLFANAIYDEREQHNTAAQFSRIVYKAAKESEVPDCDIIDKRD